jgi:CHAT domain-containing protein/tetratricopeptide (TPR) repeat protein
MGALRWILMLAAAPPQTQATQDPAAVVQHAIAAAEGDSVGALERRWQRAFNRDPADRTTALGLATVAHYTYRDSLAQHFYRVAMSGPGTDRITAYSALGLSRLAGLRGRWQAADSALQRAVAIGRATRDASLLGEALVFQGRVRLHTAGPQVALTAVTGAESILPANDLGARALARCLVSEASDSLGDSRAAVDAASEGIALAERARDTRALGTCHFALADAHGSLFAIDSSLAAYERAITSFRKARDRVGLAQALWWRGDVLRLFGRLGHARRDAAEAVREAEASRAWTFAAGGHATMARVALAVGDFQTAAAEAAHVTRIRDLHGDPYARVVASSLEASVAVALGDMAAARVAHEAAAREANATGWLNGEMGARNSLMWVALMEGDSAAADDAVEFARTMIRTRPGLQGHNDAVTFAEATLALRWGRLADAERIFRNRLITNPNRGVRRYVDGARLSEVLARTGRLDEAEHEIFAAAEELDAWRESLGDRQLRTLAFQIAADRADPDLGVASVVAALARAGRKVTAFEVVERGRARDLSDRMTRAAALDTTFIDLATRSEPTIGLDSLQRALPDDSTAVLEYVTGRGDPTTLFMVTRRHARAYVLASQDSLADRIARLTALLESGDDPRALAQELGSALLAPALADLDLAVRRWIVVPDGPLHRLPFDVLVLPDGHFVVERFAVASAPSASVAARLWERRSAAPSSRVAVLADPRFAHETNESANADVFRSALAGDRGLPRLRGSAREARAVARYSDQATVRRRGDASEAWLKRTPLAEFGIVHFATHALVDEGSVTNTALALAPEDDEDGFIGPSELANLRLAAELVVLSACRTAGGVIVRGEGVQGLAAPLIAAGARAVAATWWPIGDVATVRLVDDFYRAMAEGQVASEALRSAKLAALRRGAPPREWAAFTLVGDPLARPSLRLPAGDGRSVLLTALAGVVVALVAYGLIRKRRGAERG